MTIVADDTNVFVSNLTTSVQKREDGTMQVRQKRGMKKQQPLLGLLQCLFLREQENPEEGQKQDAAADVGRIVQVRCPSQCLPRSNWSTICSRMRRWGVFCSEGCGEPFGGSSLWSLFGDIPLKMVIMCNLSWVMILKKLLVLRRFEARRDLFIDFFTP